MSEQEPSFEEPGSEQEHRGEAQDPGSDLSGSQPPGSHDPFRLAPVTPAEPRFAAEPATEIETVAGIEPGSDDESVRAAEPRQEPAGDNSNDVVDDLLLHAAQTVETLLNEVRSSQDESARRSSAYEARDDRPAAGRSPEEMVGDVLITARRVAEAMIADAKAEAAQIAADARRDAVPVLAEAEETLRRAWALHREAQAVVTQAQTQAGSILDSAQTERERLLAGAMSEATRRRSELELSNARLETAIKDLRTEWAGRAIDALVRLEGLGLDAPPSPDDAEGQAAGLSDEPERDRPGLLPGSAPFEP